MKYTNLEFEDIPCPMGCRLDDEKVLTGYDRINNLPGEFTVVRCRQCGLMRTNPRPSPSSIGFYYPDSYGPYQSSEFQKMKSEHNNSKWKFFFRKLLHLEQTHLPPLKPGKLLEIGCASGAFLYKMADLGWQVNGIEFSRHAARKASLDFPIFIGRLEDAPDPSELYDLIVGWMVLEHLHDPVFALRKLRQWTNLNGMLVISVPNAGTIEFKLFKRNWYALQLPNHLFHYTPKTLSQILQKSGWNLKKIIYHKNAVNLLRSLNYVFIDHGWNRLGGYIYQISEAKKAKIVYILLGLLLGVTQQSGRITIWAQPQR